MPESGSIYLPFQAQPLLVMFNLEIGSLVQTYSDPEIPVQADITLENGSGGKFSITLFDQTGFDVEPYFWENINGDWATVTLQWGYLGNEQNLSPRYNIQSPGYTLEINDASFGLTIRGSMGMDIMSSSTPNRGGTLDKIIREIADQYGYIYNGAAPEFSTRYLKEYGSIERDSTEIKEFRFVKYAQEADWAYLSRIVKYAMDEQGNPGYQPRLIPTEGSNKKTLIIDKPTNDAPRWTYRVQDEKSTVVKWKPEVDFANVALGGGGFWSQANNYQKSTGDLSKQVIQPQLVEERMILHGYPLISKNIPKPPGGKEASAMWNVGAANIPEETKNGSSRQHTDRGATSPYLGSNKEINRQINEYAKLYKAELTVLGDPQIVPGFNCEVIFKYPNNYKASNGETEHYTSGIYYIDKVRHTITAGSYLTILSLTRTEISRDPREGIPSSGSGANNGGSSGGSNPTGPGTSAPGSAPRAGSATAPTSNSGNINSAVVPANERTAAMTKALELNGIEPSLENLNALEAVVYHESFPKWDPSSFNIGPNDGTGGRYGLMQLSNDVWQRNAVSGYNTNINDPVSNMAAGLGYVKGRYGSITNVPGVKNLAAGKPYGPGY